MVKVYEVTAPVIVLVGAMVILPKGDGMAVIEISAVLSSI
jgi:hypothetical protein